MFRETIETGAAAGKRPLARSFREKEKRQRGRREPVCPLQGVMADRHWVAVIMIF